MRSAGITSLRQLAGMDAAAIKAALPRLDMMSRRRLVSRIQEIDPEIDPAAAVADAGEPAAPVARSSGGGSGAPAASPRTSAASEADRSASATAAAGASATASAASSPSDPLPEGWQELPADGGGVYFYNESTGESTWDRPSADLPPPPPPPPPGSLGGSGGVGGEGGGGGGGGDFEIGGRVVVQGLASKPELNGRLGTPAALRLHPSTTDHSRSNPTGSSALPDPNRSAHHSRA